MKNIRRLLSFTVQDLARNRWVLVYALLMLVMSEMLIRFGSTAEGALMSLSNVVLLFVPLISLVLGTMYLYQSGPFIEFLLSQPVARRELFWSLYAGITIPLSLCVAMGIGIPMVMRGSALLGLPVAWILIVSGVGLTCIFTALSFWIAVRIEDRTHGLGAGLVLWLLLTLVYDGIVLLILQVFSSYPTEKAALALMFANPIDLTRILALLQFDAGALMGYTGAVFERFFGSSLGWSIATVALILWIATPLVLAQRRFVRKDF